MASTDRMTAGVPRAVSTFDVPSIMKLFEVGRAPMRLIAFPTPCRIAPCSPAVSTAPAPRNSSDRKFLPLSGRSVICFSVITWPTVAVSRVEGDRGRLHLDGLGPGAHGAGQVDARDLIDVQPDARLLGDAEARS